MYVNTLSYYTYVTDGAVRWEDKRQKTKDKSKKIKDKNKKIKVRSGS